MRKRRLYSSGVRLTCDRWTRVLWLPRFPEDYMNFLIYKRDKSFSLVISDTSELPPTSHPLLLPETEPLKCITAQDSSHTHHAPKISISGAQRELKHWWLALSIPCGSQSPPWPHACPASGLLPTFCPGQMQTSLQNICFKRPFESWLQFPTLSIRWPPTHYQLHIIFKTITVTWVLSGRQGQSDIEMLGQLFKIRENGW